MCLLAILKEIANENARILGERAGDYTTGIMDRALKLVIAINVQEGLRV